MDKKASVLQGTLDMLILKTLSLEPMHGFGVMQRILQITQNSLQIEEGSLYPALYRLEERGFIESEWGSSENNRRAKYYSLTQSGRERLEKEIANWALISKAVSQVLQES